MAPALCVTFMVHGGLLCAANVQGQIRIEVINILERFLLEKITKTELIAELVQAAGRPACRIALRAMQPQIDYVLHGNPLAEPHDYDDPTMVHLTTMTRAGTDARYCLTADDLRKMDDGRAAEWAAAQSPVKAQALIRCGAGAMCSEEEWRAIQWRRRGEKPRAAPVGLCAV